MADLTITAASVRASGSALSGGVTIASVTTGETSFAGGEVVYLDPADLDSDNIGKAKLADANGTATTAKAAGITLHPSNLNQPVQIIALDSNFIPGATLTAGMQYVLSATPGKICPVTDMASGWFYTPLFVGMDATHANLNVTPSGLQRP